LNFLPSDRVATGIFQTDAEAHHPDRGTNPRRMTRSSVDHSSPLGPPKAVQEAFSPGTASGPQTSLAGDQPPSEPVSSGLKARSSDPHSFAIDRAFRANNAYRFS